MHEPWYLEIFDHAGRLHKVNLEPGEIVFYEVRRLFRIKLYSFWNWFVYNICVCSQQVLCTAEQNHSKGASMQTSSCISDQ